MNGDAVVIVIIALILGGAIGYIYNAKRKGQRCIGCPDSKSCSGSCSGCGGSCGGKT